MSISLQLETPEATDRKRSRFKAKADDSEPCGQFGWFPGEKEVPYITSLSQEELRSILKRIVYSDPGQRDYQYMIKHTSNSNRKQTYRITSCRRNKVTKKRQFRRLREMLKDRYKMSFLAQSDPINRSPEPVLDPIRTAERELGAFSRTTTYVDEFCGYIINRARVSPTLDSFYSNTVTCKNNYADFDIPPCSPRSATSLSGLYRYRQ